MSPKRKQSLIKLIILISIGLYGGSCNTQKYVNHGYVIFPFNDSFHPYPLFVPCDSGNIISVLRKASTDTSASPITVEIENKSMRLLLLKNANYIANANEEIKYYYKFCYKCVFKKQTMLDFYKLNNDFDIIIKDSLYNITTDKSNIIILKKVIK